MKYNRNKGGMAEWLKAPTLKAGVEITTEGSNPSSSLRLARNWKRNHFKHKKKQTVKRYIHFITYY